MKSLALAAATLAGVASAQDPFVNFESGPVNAVEVTRTLMGTTNSAQAAPGTIRGDLGLSFSHNLVHGSDSLESAATELALFFPDASEICEWTPCGEEWVYNVEEELK